MPSQVIVKRITDNDRIIGANLRRIRLAADMSQEDLGHALSLTFQQVQKYEKGSNRISGSRIVQICGVLSCGLSDLFSGTTTNIEDAAKKLADPIIKIGSLTHGPRMAASFIKLPTHVRRAVCELLEQYAA